MKSLQLDLGLSGNPQAIPIIKTDGQSQGYSLLRTSVSGSLQEGKNNKKLVNGIASFNHFWTSQMGSDHDIFIIQLDNGGDIYLVYYHDQKKPIAHNGNAIRVVSTDRSVTWTKDFDFKPGNYWKPPGSRREYPGTWQLKISNPELQLEIVPAMHAPEISAMGMNMWWCTAVVTGKGRNDEKIEGRAWVLLQGY
jgi:predicted secreted hydrolase